MLQIRDNTKTIFTELCGGDIFTYALEGKNVICMKLEYEVIYRISEIHKPTKANAINLLNGELMYIDSSIDIHHHNATLELN